MTMSEKRRYLIVGPSWIGDMVMAQSLLITLKAKHSGCIIDVIAPNWSLSIIQRMPEVHEAISADVKHGEFSFFQRRKLGLRLRKNKYTHAIVLPRSWKSALVPFFAKIAVRTGYKGEFRYGLLNNIRNYDKEILKQTVQRYVAHAYPDNFTAPPDTPFPSLMVDKDNQVKVLNDNGLNLNKPVVCMMPGAEYGPAKQWPVKYYADLAGLLVSKGYQVWVLGSDKDRSSANEIESSTTDGVYSLCGNTALVDVVDLLACASSVVTNDSGLMHVAAAVGTYVNVIYGSSTPNYTPPLCQDSRKSIFYLNLDCSPCFERVCPLKHTDCLNKIKPATVLQAIEGSVRI